MPLIMMIEAAQAGNEKEVEECAKLFTDHAAKLEEVIFYFNQFSYLVQQFTLCIFVTVQFHPQCKFQLSLFVSYITILENKLRGQTHEPIRKLKAINPW